MTLTELLALPKPDYKGNKVTIDGLGDVYFRQLTCEETIRLALRRDYAARAAYRMLAHLANDKGERLLQDEDLWRLDHLTEEQMVTLINAVDKFIEETETRISDLKKT